MNSLALAGQRLVELGLQHGLQEFTGSVPEARFDRIEPVVEKMLRRLDFRLRQARCRDALNARGMGNMLARA
jgi:hypothetical protein